MDKNNKQSTENIKIIIIERRAKNDEKYHPKIDIDYGCFVFDSNFLLRFLVDATVAVAAAAVAVVLVIIIINGNFKTFVVCYLFSSRKFLHVFFSAHNFNHWVWLYSIFIFPVLYAMRLNCPCLEFNLNHITTTTPTAATAAAATIDARSLIQFAIYL